MVPPPLTRLETLLNLRGVVVVKGYTLIGTIESNHGDSVRVTAVELTDPARGDREYGLAIAVRQAGDPGVEAVSYIDADEIDALLSAIDALGKIDRDATTMEHVDADYRTRGDFEIANIERDGARYVQAQSIQVLPTMQVIVSRAFFPANRLGEIQRQIAAAKRTLDATRDAGK